MTILDAYGNIATGYLGTILFSTDDPLASLPAAFTSRTADAGQQTFTMTFETRGKHTLKATDKANSSITGEESGISVT